MLTIIAFIAIFAVLVLAHEWGHFFAARIQGIAVEEFGLGFPPRLFSRTWRGTLYSLNAVPLGGFVRIKGEEGEGAQDSDSFASRAVWQRALVIVAGVTMNIVLGWALLSFIFAVGFPQVLNERMAGIVRDRSVIIVSVLAGTPAAEAGIQSGDIIRSVDGKPLERVDDLQLYTAAHENIPMRLSVERADERLSLTLTPRLVEEADRVALGVSLQDIGTVRYPIHLALWKGVTTTGFILKEIVLVLFNVLRDLFTLHKPALDLAGPVGIAVLTGEIAARGISHLLQFAALLSLNLAVLNVLPIPALDGGRLLFLAIEKVRGRPISQHTEGRMHRIGFALLIFLILVVTYKDIVRIFFS